MLALLRHVLLIKTHALKHIGKQLHHVDVLFT